MRKDRIGVRIQKKKKRIKNLTYSKATSRAAFEELVVVVTRDKLIGSGGIGLDVMVGRGSKEMVSSISLGPEEKWDERMLGAGRVDEVVEL